MKTLAVFVSGSRFDSINVPHIHYLMQDDIPDNQPRIHIMKMLSGFLVNTTVVAVCCACSSAHAMDRWELIDQATTYPQLSDNHFEFDRPYWQLPEVPHLDLAQGSTFDAANYKSCTVESFKFSHGLMGKNYQSDVSDFYLSYIDRAVGDPTLISTGWTGYSDTAHFSCHMSGTLQRETFYGPQNGPYEDYFSGWDFNQCTDIAGSTDGTASESMIYYDPLSSDTKTTSNEQYEVSYSQTGEHESLIASVQTDEVHYIDMQGYADYFPEVEASMRTYADTKYKYSRINLTPVEVSQAKGEFSRRQVTGSNGNDGDFEYVESEHTLDGCYNETGETPVYMTANVTVEYPATMKMIPGTHQVVEGAVTMTASDGSKAEISATPGDPGNATVLLMAPMYGGTTALTVPWSELLP